MLLLLLHHPAGMRGCFQSRQGLLVVCGGGAADCLAAGVLELLHARVRALPGAEVPGLHPAINGGGHTVSQSPGEPQGIGAGAGAAGHLRGRRQIACCSKSPMPKVMQNQLAAHP